MQDQVGPLQDRRDPLHPQALRRVAAVPEAGRIKKKKGQALPLGPQLQDVPGGPRQFGDDGPLFPGQGVEKGALPGVGPARQGHPDPVPQPPGGLRTLLFHVERFPQGSQVRPEGVQVQGDALLLSVVQRRLGPGHPGG